ncbi:MAG: archaeal heat shock protein Hsp20 [Thermoplasmata archaeon]
MNRKDDEDDERKRRRRPDPFKDLFGFSDMFGFSNMDDEFKKMQKLAEKMMKQGRQRMNRDPFVYGFTVRTGPEGKPQIEEFGNAKDYFHEGEEKSEWTPLTDVQETDDSVLVTVDVPGVEKEDINLQVRKDSLKVSVDGKRKYGKTIGLPSQVNPEDAEAKYNNGVLEVELKKESEEVGKTIEIE